MYVEKVFDRWKKAPGLVGFQASSVYCIALIPNVVDFLCPTVCQSQEIVI